MQSGGLPTAAQLCLPDLLPHALLLVSGISPSQQFLKLEEALGGRGNMCGSSTRAQRG